MRFHDQARLELVAGDGGGGCVSFRREKFIARGGPNGGNGGRGGDIKARAVEGLNTLLDYRYRRHITSEQGQRGQGKLRSGRSGKDLVLDLPQGTQIFDESDGALLADLVSPSDQVLLCQGGRGGFGNAHFRSSTNRSPRMAQEGSSGESRSVLLRLKVLADVGLAGLPNAGKSSLLRQVSGSRTKVGAYAYTTLHPHLGMVSRGYEEAVFADLPGLIEGASDGAGLGHRFLAHLERCSVLLQLVAITSEETSEEAMLARAVADFRVVEEELSLYGEGLLNKRRIVVLSKGDLLGDLLGDLIGDSLDGSLGDSSDDSLGDAAVGIERFRSKFAKSIGCSGRATAVGNNESGVEDVAYGGVDAVLATSSFTGFGIEDMLSRVFVILAAERG